ncbi:unnamed protein product [Cuscuta europaea]|uniref:Uncharacterized protein n=1 Tax=Cuscuta europaea TaxID=41803 RepID=A0A9P1EK48_CUSEU|nr:unnamed protein product [Cuscuta europaea]
MAEKKNIASAALFLIFIITFTNAPQTLVAQGDNKCGTESQNPCTNKSKALGLKIIALLCILFASVIGVFLPLVTSSFPALHPAGVVFTVVKSLASGIILATGFMHVLPDSFDMLRSSCLNDNPWHRFPFSSFVAMLSAVVTMAIDSLATSMYRKKNAAESPRDAASQNVEMGFTPADKGVEEDTQISRSRVIAMVLEIGIIVHSVVIGLSLGASSNTCSIRGLIAALCFHQMFEGMGLGGCILQAQYGLLKKASMAFFFSVTTPLGIAVGIGLSNTYKENSPRALITEGLLNGSSAGLLIYMALVDLLAADFMGQKLQGSIKLQMYCFLAVLLGCGGMSILAMWA